MGHPEFSFRMAHVILGGLYFAISPATWCSAPKTFVNAYQHP